MRRPYIHFELCFINYFHRLQLFIYGLMQRNQQNLNRRPPAAAESNKFSFMQSPKDPETIGTGIAESEFSQIHYEKL